MLAFNRKLHDMESIMINVDNPSVVRCALYLRSGNGDRASLLKQEKACRAAAASHEPAWQIVDDLIFSDVESSTRVPDDRPGLRNLLNRASEKPKPFDYLLVESVEPFNRNLTNLLSALDFLTYHNIGVYFVSMGLDSRSPNFRNIVLYGKEYEDRFIRGLSEKVSRAHLAALREGRSVGGRCYGCRTDLADRFSAGRPGARGAKLSIVNEEADVVRSIFRQFDDGRSVDDIARHLNDRGVVGPAGDVWKSSSIRRILRNSRYRGTVVWNQTRRIRNPHTGRIVSQPRSEEEVVVKVAAPELRIVGNELAASVDARLGSSDRMWPAR